MVAIMSFEEDLAKAKTRVKPKSDPVDVAVGDSVYTFVFTEAPGQWWAHVTSKHPPQLDNNIDRMYGYDLRAVVAEIAETTCEITCDGVPVKPIVDRKAKPPVNQWADLFAVIDGSAYTQLADAVFALNQWAHDQRVAALKKALPPVSEASSD